MLFMKRQTLLVPEKVKVMIVRGESGAYIAELPDLDIHTEADSPAELEFMINDLLYAYFEVPKHLRMFVRYVPEKPEDSLYMNNKRDVLFRKFISSEAQRVLYS